MRYIKFILVSLCILCLVGCSNQDNDKINTESIADSNTESASTSVVEESSDFETGTEVDVDYNRDSHTLLNGFDNVSNDIYTVTLTSDGDMFSTIVKLECESNKTSTSLNCRVYFNYLDYISSGDGGAPKVITYKEFAESLGYPTDKGTIESLRLPSDNVYYDVIVVDGYTSICGDENSDIKSHYNSLDGAREKAKRGDSYSIKYNSFGREVTVNYKYGMGERFPYVDISATFPEGYDGLRILGLGQDRNSCAGKFADMNNMGDYIDKKDLSKIFKVWGTEGDNDMLELSTFADFIFSKDDLRFDDIELGNQYFFGGSLGSSFKEDTFVERPDEGTYSVPAEQTWFNMLERSIVVYNPYLD